MSVGRVEDQGEMSKTIVYTSSFSSSCVWRRREGHTGRDHAQSLSTQCHQGLRFRACFEGFAQVVSIILRCC